MLLHNFYVLWFAQAFVLLFFLEAFSTFIKKYEFLKLCLQSFATGIRVHKISLCVVDTFQNIPTQNETTQSVLLFSFGYHIKIQNLLNSLFFYVEVKFFATIKFMLPHEKLLHFFRYHDRFLKKNSIASSIRFIIFEICCLVKFWRSLKSSELSS